MVEPNEESRGPARRPRRRYRKRPRAAGQQAAVTSLQERTGGQFNRRDRQGGLAYVREGRVRLEVEGTRARIHIDGQDRPALGVGLDWSRAATDHVLQVFCQCGRFAEGRPCKHLWAAIVAVANSGPEYQPPGSEHLSVQRDRAENWLDLGAAPSNGSSPSNAVAAVDPIAPPARRPRVAIERGRGRRRAQPGEADLFPGASAWRAQLQGVRTAASRPLAPVQAASVASNLRFLIQPMASASAGALVLELVREGGRGEPAAAHVAPEELETYLLAGAEEGERSAVVLAALPAETPQPASPGRRGRRRGRVGRDHHEVRPAQVHTVRVPWSSHREVLARLAERGVLGWRTGSGFRPLAFAPEPAWQLALHLIVRGEGVAGLRAIFERGSEHDPERAPLNAAHLVLAPPERPATDGADDRIQAGLLLVGDSVGTVALDPQRDLPWIELLRGIPEVVIPKRDLDDALAALLEMPNRPRLELPDELRLRDVSTAPRPCLSLASEGDPLWPDQPLAAELLFQYGERRVNAGDPHSTVVDRVAGTYLRRDMEAEDRALIRLVGLGLQPVSSAHGHGLEVSPRDLPTVAEPLLREGWIVEVEGTALRAPSAPSFRVESGIDWFELKGGVDFEGAPVGIGAALAAIKRGDRFIQLEDGTRGLLPAAWLETYDSLAKLATDSTEDGLRFLPSQALLVDTLLAATPPTVDDAFAELRARLQSPSVGRVEPKKEPKSFVGTLRSYQRQGLGWLAFLREFGLGGVLADDMGLGKTVQLLALVQSCRTGTRKKGRPFLVVAPRSLVYNWLDEAARFTPKLEVLEYSGEGREALREKLDAYDLVITTYGTLRRDIGYLATVEFDTVVLDEAQAIKTRESQAAKASRLLRAKNRLALTGTPIENHLGELGSLFEFLNPGLFGRLPRLDALAGGRAPTKAELGLVAEGMRPFILRRTKAQVLPDLPPKTEQTLHTTLNPRQRELYDQLRAHYQANLLDEVDSKGMGGAAFQVLEALLRLRQVACHPGLVDPSWEEAGSAKLEALYEQITEVLDEGDKVIVFSQFTKLLAYVRKYMDAEGIPYAYLDGKTRDRGEVVERFQTDPGCNLFLISLKAGGVGLNLTAASYVFLLDPWWNPAVEAQAIDRAHRIGQEQPVFAYRMIASDTVEEKILALQRSKRELADAILEGEGKVLGELTAEDLRLLLS